MKGRVRDRGILVKTSNYSESSLVMRVYTQGHGMIGILAKGIRKKQDAELPAPLCEYDFCLYEPQEGGLYLLSEFAPLAELDFAADPEKWAAAECALELYSALIIPAEETAEYYRLLQTWLDFLTTLAGSAILVWWRFLLRVFKMLGVALDVETCSECRKSGKAAAAWDQGNSGLLCGDCLAASANPSRFELFSPAASRILGLLPEIGNYLDSLKPSGRAVRELNSFFAAYYQTHFNRLLKLRSLGVLEQFYC